jgi:2,3-bisphosphoglycerate-independent phosphoglycerate mutase
LEEAYKRLFRLESNKMRREKGELEANMLLVRGAGVYPRIESFESKFGMSPVCVAGAGLYKGVARMLGMKVVEVAGATGTGDTNVKAKIEAAIKASREHEFVFVHIKAADSYGEDGDAVGKKKFLENVDQGIAELVGLENVLVVVTADHSTPCAFKGHSGDPVPVVMVGEGVRTDAVTSFGERSCVAGGLGRIRGVDVMRLVISVLGTGEKFGA